MILLAVAALGVPRLFEPSTLVLARAVLDLGPISGWRCAQSAPYVYDPHRERPDSTLLVDAPEDTLRATVARLEVDRVEASLQGGDTVTWTRVLAEDQSDEERRVYVLSPGRLQAIGNDPKQGRIAICYSQLGDWRIVAEHGLQ
jgi:hypothetical protein